MFSFEFFPPKTEAGERNLYAALAELRTLEPSFVSVTYRGGRESRQRTHDLVAGMLRTTSLTPMAHLICVEHSRLELAEVLVAFRKAGVENLLALGGDPPVDVGAGGMLAAALRARLFGRQPGGPPSRPGGLPRRRCVCGLGRQATARRGAVGICGESRCRHHLPLG